MVLIAAAVCSKSGKTIISRQFVEMTKARIEGLLAAFPKLMVTGKQHTFVETDSVRYVYQPLEKLYMLLITTKASNILEDLETLRLFSKVTPEYCRTLDEKDILENAFELIFAFDEIIALGYRESVNLSQIKTFVEMDSHEEKLFQAVRQTQEREAKLKMKEKAKELQMQRLEASRKGLVGMGRGGGGFGGSSSEGFGGGGGSGSGSLSSATGISNMSNMTSIINEAKSSSASKPAPSRNAMKLGGKSKDVDSFVDQLKNEGEKIMNLAPAQTSGGSGAASATGAPLKPKPVSDVPMEAVHLKVEDKLTMQIGRDGGLQQFELIGLLTLRISDEKFGRVRVKIANEDIQGVQMQTHPNVDKDLFRQQNQIRLKNPAKPFPLNTDVGVLKWRLQTQEDSAVPLQINCWPSENGEGGCDVNIEYELEHQHLELQDVVIAIPLPINTSPTIAECDGEYKHEARKNLLLWTLPVVNGSSKQGAMEFSVPSSIPGDFFPIQVSFQSKTSYAQLKVADVVSLVDGDTDGDSVKFSTETYFYPEKYEIV